MINIARLLHTSLRMHLIWNFFLIVICACVIGGCKRYTPAQEAVRWTRATQSEFADLADSIAEYRSKFGHWPNGMRDLLVAGLLPTGALTIINASPYNLLTPTPQAGAAQWIRYQDVWAIEGSPEYEWGRLGETSVIAIANHPSGPIEQCALLLKNGDIVFLSKAEYDKNATKWIDTLYGWRMW